MCMWDVHVHAARRRATCMGMQQGSWALRRHVVAAYDAQDASSSSPGLSRTMAVYCTMALTLSGFAETLILGGWRKDNHRFLDGGGASHTITGPSMCVKTTCIRVHLSPGPDCRPVTARYPWRCWLLPTTGPAGCTAAHSWAPCSRLPHAHCQSTVQGALPVSQTSLTQTLQWTPSHASHLQCRAWCFDASGCTECACKCWPNREHAGMQQR
jgi:hypothetical protein